MYVKNCVLFTWFYSSESMAIPKSSKVPKFYFIVQGSRCEPSSRAINMYIILFDFGTVQVLRKLCPDDMQFNLLEMD